MEVVVANRARMLIMLALLFDFNVRPLVLHGMAGSRAEREPELNKKQRRGRIWQNPPALERRRGNKPGETERREDDVSANLRDIKESW